MNKNSFKMTWHFCLPCKYVPTDVCTAETADAWAATISMHLPTLFCLHRLHSPDSCSKGTFHKSKYHFLSENAINSFRITISAHQRSRIQALKSSTLNYNVKQNVKHHAPIFTTQHYCRVINIAVLVLLPIVSAILFQYWRNDRQYFSYAVSYDTGDTFHVFWQYSMLLLSGATLL